MRFLGVDLAWKDGNSSGVALLGGQRFPLHLREVPHTLPSHQAVLDWIARHVAHHRAAVGIDAPLLGVRPGRRRRCDNEIARAFGRFHASTHSANHVPALRRLARSLVTAYGIESFGPDVRPRSRRPALREVYPNALQVELFGLEARPGLRILKYKRRRFASTREWAERGLAPFVRSCAEVIGGRYVVTRDPAWSRLVAGAPESRLGGRELKAIEDRWDALLCALAVALEFFGPRGGMRFYPDEPEAWRQGFILAPTRRHILNCGGTARAASPDPRGPGGAGRPSGDGAQ